MSYKVVHLVKDKIKTVYRFSGTDNNDRDKIFPDAINVEQQIHFDDSVHDVKLKILNELSKTMQITIGELYLFCKRKEVLSSEGIYQILTKNQEHDLVDNVFKNMVKNIDSDRNGDKLILAEKSIYEVNDLLDMKLDDEFTVTTALGQREFVTDYENPVIANPYNIEQFDRDIDRLTTRVSLLGLDQHLILDTGVLVENVIYLCTARDVLEQASISQKNILKLYFPMLYDKNINSLQDLIDNPPEDSDELLDDKTLESYEKVNMFYDIHNQPNNPRMTVLNRGIKYARVIIRPKHISKIPIEAIFKIVHATQTCIGFMLIKKLPMVTRSHIWTSRKFSKLSNCELRRGRLQYS
jgi:hypothetical protein